MKSHPLLIVLLIVLSCSTPTANTAFRIDLTSNKTYVYDFQQNVTVHNRMVGMSARTSALADLVLMPVSDSMAELSLTNLELVTRRYGTDGRISDSTNLKPNPITLRYLNSLGQITDSTVENTYRFLMPLPNGPLFEGESSTIEHTMPLTYGKNALELKGTNTLTFNGFDTLLGRHCVVINGLIDITQPNFNDSTGSYFGFTKGKATYYFDSSKGLFIGADLKLTMMVHTIPVGADSSQMTHLENENIIRYRLREIIVN